MSPVRPSFAPTLGLAVGLGLAACTEGCGHGLPISEVPRPQIVEPMSVAELSELLWSKTDEDWIELPEVKLVALEKLVRVLMARAAAGSLSAGQAEKVADFASYVGLELREIEVELGDARERLWLLIEPEGARYGRGSYLFRVGDVDSAGRVEHVLQAPHSYYDRHTGEIALGVFLEPGAGHARPRALFVNSVHRYRKPGGHKRELEPATANVADAAHASDHPIARATRAVLGRRRPVAIVQLHGFERRASSGDPHVIVSAGVETPDAASLGIERRTRAALPEFSVGHFGVDVGRLGATTNIQGHAAREVGRCFVHFEMSGELRDHLREQRSARQKLAGVLFGAEPGELRGGCR